MLEEDNVYTINQFGQMDLQKVNWGVETLPVQSTWFLMNQGNDARDIINKMIEPIAVVTDSHPIDISDFTNLSDEESQELTDRLNITFTIHYSTHNQLLFAYHLAHNNIPSRALLPSKNTLQRTVP